MDNLTDIYTRKMTEELNSRKEALIKKALFKVVGEEIDLLVEANQVFPRIAITSNPDGGETYWWNSGKNGAVRVITFTAPTVHFEGTNKITAEINHY